MKELGFVGLGAMGSAMAANLVKAGHTVRALNRSSDGAKTVDGVSIVSSPTKAFRADAAFTMLSNDPAIRSVLLDTGVLDQVRAGLVHVVTSTISVNFAGELAEAHEKARLGYVSAPVLGQPDVAKDGQLNILAAGKPAAVAEVRALLEALGKTVWDMGKAPARANAAKIAANMMITMAIEALAKAVVLTEANGLPRTAFFELILGTLFGGRSSESYSAKIAKDDHDLGFKARLGLNDLTLAAAAAEATGRTLPILDAVRGRMAEAVDAGMGDKDWSAMADFTLHRAT